ncbi:MAG: ATP-binding protein [Rhodobacteraceae bacterium]|nr:ATP-binding protein [Paracoccaceae bacterium]
MQVARLSRVAAMALILAAVAMVAGGVWVFSYRQALDQAAAQGQSDLALAADRLQAQLRRFQEMAVLLADHPTLVELSVGGDVKAAQDLLLTSSDKTGALNLVFISTDKRILASAIPEAHSDLVDSAYVARALQGALGSDYGFFGPDRRRAYFYAAPYFRPGGDVGGVLVVVVDIDNVEFAWRGSNPSIFFTGRDGAVFVTNRNELLSWQRSRAEGPLIAPGKRDSDYGRRIVGGHELWYGDWGQYVPSPGLHLQRHLPVIDMTGETLIDLAPARRLAALQAAVVVAVLLFFSALLFLATERRRALAEANAKLEARVSARTRALVGANDALRREVTERQEAESALKQAQAELVQAGKLSALGKMSAGISHELNQPLMAIRSFAENGEAFLERGRTDRAVDNLNRISDMARRMGRIIKNLRAFARQESEPLGRVDIVAVLQSAIELAEGRLKTSEVTLHWSPPAGPLWVRGGEVRLGQVFVNLIGNAADAMEGLPNRGLFVDIQQEAPLKVIVRDTGPGLHDPEKIFDPFYTTKAVGDGEGMGLGLSISYGLVQSFGGTIRGANAPDGGAVFTVELEPWPNEVVA